MVKDNIVEDLKRMNEGELPPREYPSKNKIVKPLNKTREEIMAQMKKDGFENPEEQLVKPGWQYMKYLGDENLFNLITVDEFDKKIVGEIETRKVIFLCSCGRLVKNHQVASYNLLVNDDAGVGKDYVCGAVLNILPKDFYIHKTRISPTVFTYWHNPKYEPEWTWDGLVFYPEDISENVLNSDVFKVMSSAGSSATVVIKQRAYEIDICGKPVMITTTASATPNPELTRRFVILNLDSSQDQTKEIMKRHSKFKEEGIVPEYNCIITESLKYLKRVKVKIPFASLIDKHFPSKNIIMRTHYPRFLDFISASAALYQYQRDLDDSKQFILAKGQDYDIARECFIKLCSNKYMIPLTINQKKILGIFEQRTDLNASASQFHSDYNFLSLKAMITNLGILCKYGILETKTERNEYGRELEIYSLSQSYNPNEKLEIPKFSEIMKNSSKVAQNDKNHENDQKFQFTDYKTEKQKRATLPTLPVIPESCLPNSAEKDCRISKVGKVGKTSKVSKVSKVSTNNNKNNLKTIKPIEFLKRR